MDGIFEVEIGSLSGATSYEIALAAVKALDCKKAKDIKVLRIDKKTTIADYFVLCTGNSTTQVRTLADEVEYQLNRGNTPYVRLEGSDCVDWKVVDARDVIIHVFTNEARDFYKLEKLWADAEEVDIDSIIIK